jgi:hypothetical protein
LEPPSVPARSRFPTRRLLTTPRCATLRVRLIVRPVGCVRAFTCRRARGGTGRSLTVTILGGARAPMSPADLDRSAYTDSIARLGRAVAVTLIAATQRPTQKAMGRGAVRSQRDLRICFRVREPRDVDLVLGQGMLRAGWDAHNLNAPVATRRHHSTRDDAPTPRPSEALTRARGWPPPHVR